MSAVAPSMIPVLGSDTFHCVATETITKLIDDLDGTSDADVTVAFALDGRGYEADLTTEHADQLRDALQPYIGAARKADTNGGGHRKPAKPEPGGKNGLSKDEAAAVREWVRDNGGKIGDRGRIPKKYVEAYRNGDTTVLAEPETVDAPEPVAVDAGRGVGDPFTTAT